MKTWIIATGDGPLAGAVAAVRELPGNVTIAAVGRRDLADAAAAAGPDAVCPGSAGRADL